MGKHCSYGVCNSDSRYGYRDHMKGVTFIPFPKPKTKLDKCELWISACGRPKEDFNIHKITKDTYICTKHFVGGAGPTDDHPDPLPATASSEKIEAMSRKRKKPFERASPKKKRKRLEHMESDLPNIHSDTQLQEQGVQTESSGTAEKNTQTYTPITSEMLKTKLENMRLLNESRVVTLSVPVTDSPQFSINKIKGDDAKMKYYTSLTYDQFQCLFRFLGPSVDKLTYWNQPRKNNESKRGSRPGPQRKLSPQDELLLTLMRMKRGLQTKDLAYRFQISSGHATSVIITWVQFMYLQFERLDCFPSRADIKKTLPPCFKPFRNIRVIVDATEFFCASPKSDFGQQGNLYSSYKSHTTFKVLVGIIPTGGICFVSDAFEGSISDIELFRKSGILDRLDTGDMVMADRGFTVYDMLHRRGVSLNIPPFMKGQDRLSVQDEARTKAIARVRIHVERAIERIKSFRLFSRVIPLSLQPVFTQLVKVAAHLVNFEKPLVK